MANSQIVSNLDLVVEPYQLASIRSTYPRVFEAKRLRALEDEQVSAKLKHLLRKAAERTAEAT